MDTERFDAFTRSLGATKTRRQALKLLAGSAAGGLLALFGINRVAGNSLKKPDLVKNASSDDPLIEINPMNPTELQQFLGEAEQNDDFLTLRDYFIGFGFSRKVVEGARSLIHSSIEIKIMTEIFTSVQQPGVSVQLTFAQVPENLPTGEESTKVYLPFITKNNNTNLRSSVASSHSYPDNVVSVVENNLTESTQNLVYSITLDSARMPLVGHYLNSTGEITAEFPSSFTSASAFAPQYSISTQNDKCATCKDNCKRRNYNLDQIESLCGWLGFLVCVPMGLVAAGVSAGWGAGVGILCGFPFAAGCGLPDQIDCDSKCEEVCKDCNDTNKTLNTTLSAGTEICFVGQMRLKCGDNICAPAEICEEQADGSKICTAPEGTCPEDTSIHKWHFVGYYRYGSGVAPYCCLYEGGVNCGADASGYWIGCCPSGMLCCRNRPFLPLSCYFPHQCW